MRRCYGQGFDLLIRKKSSKRSCEPIEVARGVATDITYLMAFAYPKNDSPLSRRIALDYFSMTIGDPELEIKVRERAQPDLQAAYKTVIRLKTLRNASSAREARRISASKGPASRASLPEQCR